MAQAAPEKLDCLWQAAKFLVNAAQIEQRERILRLVLMIQLQESQIALQLTLPQGGILVASMVDLHIGPADLAAQTPDRRQNLLVYAVLPDGWSEYAEEPQTEGELAALRRGVRRGCPFGTEPWCLATAARLGLQATLRPLGRPRLVAETPSLFLES